MGTILVHVAVEEGLVKRSSLEVLSRCRVLGDATGLEVCAVALGSCANNVLGEITAYGPDRILVLADPSLHNPVNRVLIDALTSVIEHTEPEVVVFSSSERIKDILGALSVRVGAAALPEVASFTYDGRRLEVDRPVMAANQLATVESTESCTLVSVLSGAYEAEEKPSDPVVEDFDFTPGEAAGVERLKDPEDILDDTLADAVDLGEARIVVAAGRGVRDENGRALILELAGLFGGATGASRAVVESGLFPASAQIGQTGKVVSPDLYFAVGISGAIQHVAGMANSRVIVAINKDAEAPIFDYATYGLVGDLYEIVPLLIEKLKDLGLRA